MNILAVFCPRYKSEEAGVYNGGKTVKPDIISRSRNWGVSPKGAD